MDIVQILKFRHKWSIGPLLLAIGLSSVSARAETHTQRPREDRADCVAHLEHIYKMIKRVEHHSGTATFPTLEDLAWGTRDKSVFVCAEDPSTTREARSFYTSYMMLNNPHQHGLTAVPYRDIAIVAEKAARRDGHRLVLFYDGTVSELTRQEFEALQAHGFVRQS